MKEIIMITDGAIIMVDDEDYAILSRFSWCRAGATGHPESFIYGKKNTSKTIYMHQIIMGGKVNTDHIDGNPLNNQKSNLRAATHQENGWNKGKPKTCRHGAPTSQYKGVSFRPLRDKPRWIAMIKHVEPGKHKNTGKIIRIGYFDTEKEAAIAYDKKVLELRGKWAWTNILKNNNTEVSSSGGSDV